MATPKRPVFPPDRSTPPGGFMAGSFAFRRAVRRRTLPANADPLVWHPMIIEQEATLKFAPVVSILCVGVVVYFGFAEGIEFWTGDVMSAGVAIFLLAVAVFSPIDARSRRAGLRALREQLDAVRNGQAGQTPPATGRPTESI